MLGSEIWACFVAVEPDGHGKRVWISYAVLRRFWLDVGGLTSARYWARVKLVASQVRRSGDF